jgi:hypothetical protein
VQDNASSAEVALRGNVNEAATDDPLDTTGAPSSTPQAHVHTANVHPPTKRGSKLVNAIEVAGVTGGKTVSHCTLHHFVHQVYIPLMQVKYFKVCV